MSNILIGDNLTYLEFIQLEYNLNNGKFIEFDMEDLNLLCIAKTMVINSIIYYKNYRCKWDGIKRLATDLFNYRQNEIIKAREAKNRDYIEMQILKFI